ncbi:MAG: hypothetical protein Kow0013_18300 [Pararhodobacter sp.]
MNRLFASVVALTLTAAPALAGSVADFEAAHAATHASYRTALFATGSGDAARAGVAMEELDNGWAGLMSQYRSSPPPQYEDDPLWGQTLTEVTDILDQATADVSAGDLEAAHLTLEGVRDALGALHARNNIETFSDRMNAYHAEMEAVLDIDLSELDAATRQRLLEHSAVLAYLARDVLAAPPAAAEGNAQYAQLAAAMQASVDQFVAAARAGDDDALRAAIAGLKVPYSRLFVNFG